MSIQLAIFLIFCALFLGFFFAATFRSGSDCPPRARTLQDGEGHPVYEIYTISDCLRIPDDRFNIFLKEFPYLLSYAKAIHGLNPIGLKLPVRWIDDDKGEVNLTLNGNDLLKIKIEEPAHAG